MSSKAWWLKSNANFRLENSRPTQIKRIVCEYLCIHYSVWKLWNIISLKCWAFYPSISELPNTHFFKTLSLLGIMLTTKAKENTMWKLGSLVTPKYNGGWVFNLCILWSHPVYLSGKCFWSWPGLSENPPRRSMQRLLHLELLPLAIWITLKRWSINTIFVCTCKSILQQIKTQQNLRVMCIRTGWLKTKVWWVGCACGSGHWGVSWHYTPGKLCSFHL